MNLLESLIPSDFRRSLDARLRRFFIATFINCVGTGLTLSLYVVYLHNVHGFSTTFSTLLLACAALAGLVTSPLWGSATDHFGPVKVILVALVTNGASLVYWAYIHSETSAVIGAVLLAVFGNAGWGPGSTLLVRLVAPQHRQRAYGFNFMMVNLGIGFGGLISASVVNLHDPLTFRRLYLGNVIVTLLASFFFATLWKYGHLRDRPRGGDDSTTSDGWRVVFRDRRLVLYVSASLVLMLGGYGALDSGFSLFVVNNLHMSVHIIGVVLFVNTSTIVLAQLVVVNIVERRSRTRVLALVSTLWAVFWIALAISLHLSRVVAVVAICAAMVVFAIGETMLSPVGQALVNEIAPEHLRGRYNAAQGLTWGVSGSIAPAITAIFFDNHLGDWWPVCVAGLSLVGGAMMLNLRRRLTTSEDGRARPGVL